VNSQDFGGFAEKFLPTTAVRGVPSVCTYFAITYELGHPTLGNTGLHIVKVCSASKTNAEMYVRSKRISELCVLFCGIANITDLIFRLPHKQNHRLVTNCYSQNGAATARDNATDW
jgi:hypothetical protein